MEKELAMDIATWTQIIGWGIIIIGALVGAIFTLVTSWISRQEKANNDSQNKANTRHEAILDKLSSTNIQLTKLSTVMTNMVEQELPSLKQRVARVEDRLNNSSNSPRAGLGLE